MSMEHELAQMGDRARAAARELAVAGAEAKNGALRAMAAALRKDSGLIRSENAKDLEDGRAAGLSAATLDRLALDESRIEGMASGLEEIAALQDPIGTVLGMWTVDRGLKVGRVRVPLGVVGIIYEARPNVTADAAGLCLKSGNAVILRGGKEALRSNVAIAGALRAAATGAGMPEGAVQLVSNPDRTASVGLMRLQALDVLIPRGGKALKAAVTEHARVPYIMTGDGNCHTFVDASADVDMALDIAVNAKTQRSAVCNAMETLLVHRDIAKRFVPAAMEAMASRGVELRGDEDIRALYPDAKPASEEDWDTEYHDMILAVRVVDGIEEAMEHIHRHGTKHSEAIVTESYANAQRFLAGVDAAAVYVNASTRFTDGGVFGFGAEMGISTQKLHARGPMGIEQLTSTKFVIYGTGQIRGTNPEPLR
ncbi:glutamate-5-semialdehyde dehydrogenase [Fretibacterium sp. OH1220_COT-178]|uniref:glutamate-5-semialdehyde dehydrogenase n=1 Tax=Fretibacterium sp. OH1220_COT-178 TaxID=2491047 RepID=UPI000F5E66EC|nr:glutamate-5-semialdehyde dehydrogenase [Fretibacterium sp. OH1220_COT-178]RRD64203.1 glutamate-5-semialdehyde dehydrogenase [Fretibacterium sp. OH1220_COT-178]